MESLNRLFAFPSIACSITVPKLCPKARWSRGRSPLKAPMPVMTSRWMPSDPLPALRRVVVVPGELFQRNYQTVPRLRFRVQPA